MTPSTEPAPSDDQSGSLPGEGAGRLPSGLVNQILARSGLVQGVEPSAYSSLVRQLHLVDFPRRHTVFVEGDPGDRLFIIVRGKAKVGRRSADGRENLLAIMGPSDIFGELAIFDPGPRTSTVTTITELSAVSKIVSAGKPDSTIFASWPFCTANVIASSTIQPKIAE